MEKLGLQKTQYMEGFYKNFAPLPSPVPILSALLQSNSKNTEFFRDFFDSGNTRF